MSNTSETVPVCKNDIISLHITSMGSDGQGIGRHRGFVVFVPFALPGETVEALIIKVAAGHAIGKLIRILESAASRVDPRCPVFRRCGGCQLQHMDYPSQLDFKRNAVVEA